jgi:hypothetical protein
MEIAPKAYQQLDCDINAVPVAQNTSLSLEYGPWV